MISVIVPVFNAEAYLRECIQSILAQDYHDFELLLIVDGAQDSCINICQDFRNNDPRIQVFKKDKGGPSSARNYGLDRAHGDYITFVDADDFISKNYLSYLLQLLDQYPECNVSACSHLVLRNGRMKPAGKHKRKIQYFIREEAFLELLYHGAIDVSAWGKLYRASVFEDLRFPDGRIYEDTWIIGDILMKTPGIVTGRKYCYCYRMHQGSIVNSDFSSDKLQFIEAAEKLSRDALICTRNAGRWPGSSRINRGCIRRINHARLSVLRYMGNCRKEYRPLRKELRNKILAEAPKYLMVPETPMRDRFAILLLSFGYIPFFGAWTLHKYIR